MADDRVRRTLTPLESELHVGAEPSRPRRARRRLLPRRLTRPPQTLAGAIAVGLARLVAGVAIGSALALLLARLLGRPASIGFYLLGAIILLGGLVGAQASRQRTMYEYGQSGRPVRARPGLVLAAVGVLLLVVGGILETV